MTIPKNAFKTKEEAKKIWEDLKRFEYGVVERVKKKKKAEKPPLLHSLTTLQREANKLYGFSANRTLAIAQKLYEERKIISYPRTDSQYLAESNKPLVVEVLKKLGKEDLVPEVSKVGKRVFNDSKLTDHHAIIPLETPPPDLTPEERKIYELIKRRFLGSFMKDYVYEITTVIIKVSNYKFIAKGKVDIQLGWKSLYKEKETEESLPPLVEGEKIKKVSQKIEEHQTTPPPRYTEGTLLKKMEKLGLGTPATRAQIIETLKRRNYITIKGKNIFVGPKAIELISKIGFSEIASPEMTAQWERALENIYLKKAGFKGYQFFIEKVKEFTAKEVNKIKSFEFKIDETTDISKSSKSNKAGKGKSRFKKFKKSFKNFKSNFNKNKDKN